MKNKSCFGNYLKFQLKNSFVSPFFVLITILFYLFVGINFFIRQQFFTGSGSSDLLLYFSIVPYICVITIPALCYKSSIHLYDDFIPLKSIFLIVAQFTNIIILYAIQVLLLIPGALFVNLFGQIDFGQLFTSLVCLILYGACIISICLFINQLFSSKITAFIISAIFLMIFHVAHLGAVYLPIGNGISSLLKKISFAWRFDAAGKGIIDTRDILFFILITLIFLVCSSLYREKSKGKKSSKKEKTTNLCFILILVLLLLNSGRWYKRIDISSNKTFSLTNYTNQLLNKIDDTLKITYYRSSSLNRLYPQIRDVSDYLNSYASKNKYITYKIVDPDKNYSIIENLQSYGITSQQMRSINKSSTEYSDVFSAIILEYKGIIQTIPFTMSAETLEYDLDSKIKFLMNGKFRIVNLVIGNGMSINEDYNYIIPWLNLQGFVVNVIELYNPQFSYELENTFGPLMVIGDSEINIEKAIAIENYILKEKGNAIFAISPYSVDIENDWSISLNKNTNIVEIIENWGITFLPEITADISCSRITMYSQDESEDVFNQTSTYTKNINYPLWVNVLSQKNSKSGITLFWPNTLQLSGNAEPYLVSTSKAYSYEFDRASPKRLIETNPFMLEESDTSNMTKETKIMVAEIKGSLEGLFNYGHCNNSKIIVIPDQYFLNTLMVSYNGGDSGDFRNFDFITNCLLKLNNEEELAEIQGRSQKDKSLYKVTNGYAFMKLQVMTYFVLFIIIPIFMILLFVCIKILNLFKSKKAIKTIKEDLDEK